MKITAHAAAEALRMVADALDKAPETLIKKPNLWWMFHEAGDKEIFKHIARILPRPLKKSDTSSYSSNPDVIVAYNSEAIDIDIRIPKSLTCKIVKPAQPAEYECEPLLSEEEESTLTSAE